MSRKLRPYDSRSPRVFGEPKDARPDYNPFSIKLGWLEDNYYAPRCHRRSHGVEFPTIHNLREFAPLRVRLKELRLRWQNFGVDPNSDTFVVNFYNDEDACTAKLAGAEYIEV
jgi:hypothetical protein